MSSVLRNTITFTNVADGGQQTQAHGLNVNSVSTQPDVISIPEGFSYVASTATTITVQNDSGSTATGVVMAQIIHTTDRCFPLGAANMTTKPFVITSGSGGGGGGGGGTQYVFVFRPGGSASGNVYTSFATLYAAAQAVEGEKLIQFDDSAGAITVTGAFDLSGYRLEGFDGSTPMTIGAGVTLGNGGSMTDLVVNFTGANTVEGELKLYNTQWTRSGAAAIEASDASVYLLEGSEVLNPSQTLWWNTTTGPVAIYGGEGSRFDRNTITTTNGYTLNYLAATAALSALQNGDDTAPSQAAARDFAFQYTCDGTEGTTFNVPFPYNTIIEGFLISATVVATFQVATTPLLLVCALSGNSIDVTTSGAVANGDIIGFHVKVDVGNDLFES